ncbi:MAG: tagaturonate epimerase family protein [Bryobacteraceae bacterium]
MLLPKYSVGVGDRFAHQARAQLRACMMAAAQGVTVSPVWNKSHREHGIVGSAPSSVRIAADAAVRKLGWQLPYFVDADHINLGTVDGFIEASDFFTLDVAAAIGRPTDTSAFLNRHPEFADETARSAAGKYLFAVEEAARIYRYVAERKGAGNFVTEVSMDETDAPQTPPELRVILAALADLEVPVQTIAPKFTGRFNKGVDYVGDARQFEAEFRADIEVIAEAVERYGLPANLKLSVHSGSDKFCIYGAIRRALRDFGAGVHLKTAGTTWLEELIGLAEAGGEALALAQEIYAGAYERRDELCAPYASVIDIRMDRLPAPAEVSGWSAGQFTGALRHEQSNPAFNPDLRQLLHVGYKIAAKMGARYLDMLEASEEHIARNVTANIFERHIRPVFL